MHVIGTAGHIDHGKSTLIRALTGIDPDRLKEEKERGMTIDLGFAWITLPSGKEAGIVDVPGHHRFVPNMLAGVGGISMALFIVAATESWMPQSQEHLNILNLLGIERGIVVLTKTDLVEPDWLEMVTEEVKEKLQASVLQGAEVIPVSSTTGEGLPYLAEKIDAMLDEVPSPADSDRPRLWVDRVFTIRGAGTVVTGTLEGGYLRLEQVLQILPQAKEARVRGLQTHKRPVEKAEPGARVAVNLAGVDTEELQRGDALVGIDQWRSVSTVNVHLRLLPELEYSLPQRSELRLYVGSADVPASVRLLDKAELLPGEAALAQLQLERAVAAGFHDRFVLRDATRQDTVGGGIILDAYAQPVRGRDLRMPRKAPGAYQVLSRAKVPIRRLDLDLLRSRIAATPEELVRILLAERGWMDRDELRVEVPMQAEALSKVLGELEAAGRTVVLPSYAIEVGTWESLSERFQEEISTFHSQYPLRTGLGRETLRSRLGMSPRLFEEAVNRLIRDGVIDGEGATLHQPDFTPAFTTEQKQIADAILHHMEEAGFALPDIDDLRGEFDPDGEIVNALVEQGKLEKIGQGLVCLKETLTKAKREIEAIVADEGTIDVGAFRDKLGTTRKYAVPLMEYFDQIGFTRRVGDKRVLVKKG